MDLELYYYYVLIRIRIQKANEYGSNTDPDLKNGLLLRNFYLQS